MAAIVGLIFTGLFGIAGIAIFAVSVYSMVYWIRKVKSMVQFQYLDFIHTIISDKLLRGRE